MFFFWEAPYCQELPFKSDLYFILYNSQEFEKKVGNVKVCRLLSNPVCKKALASGSTKESFKMISSCCADHQQPGCRPVLLDNVLNRTLQLWETSISNMSQDTVKTTSPLLQCVLRHDCWHSEVLAQLMAPPGVHRLN